MNSTRESGAQTTASGRRRATARHAATIVGLIALGLFVHRANLTYGLSGHDTYVQIFTSRIQSWADFCDTFREPLGDEFILAAFYRPVQNLSIALDYALWKLEPLGYQLTTLVWFAGCVALLYLAVRKLLGPDAWLAPALATLFFVLHPTPLNVLPAPCRRPDLLVIVFLLAALLVLPHGGQWSWRRFGLAGVFVLLATGSKETGILGLGLVFLHQLLFAGQDRLKKRLRPAALATFPAALAVAIYVINRAAVVGGGTGVSPAAWLGGYWAERSAPYGVQFTSSAAQLAMDVLCPWSFLSSWTPFQLAGWPLAVLGLAVPLLVVAGLLADDQKLRRAGRTTLIALVWMLPVVLVLGVNPRYGPWYAMTPLIGLVLILAALIHVAGATFMWTGLTRWLGLAAVAGVLVVAVVALPASPLWTQYPQWQAATSLLTATQKQVEEQLPGARPRQTIRARLVPRYGQPIRPERPHTPSPRRPTLYGVRIWKAEGVQTWLRLRYPRILVQTVYVGDPDPPRLHPHAIRLLLEIDRTGG